MREKEKNSNEEDRLEEGKIQKREGESTLPLVLERALISTPYCPPMLVTKRIRGFALKLLEMTGFQSMEKILEDFKLLEPYLTALFALRAIDRFELQLDNVTANIELLEELDNEEDMNLPFADVLERTKCEQITVNLHLDSTDSVSVLTIADSLKSLNMQVTKLQIIGLNEASPKRGSDE